jgi:hypothetical protein
MTRREEVRYAAVLLNGPEKALTRFAVDLRKSQFDVGRPNSHILCIDDVSDEELKHIVAEADSRGCYVESVRGTHFVELVPQVKKAEKTTIEAGTWYYAEAMEDSYPFVYVRSKRKEAMDSMGLSPEEVVVLQLELLDGEGSTPKKLQADARKVADFGLRVATEEDFAEWDLPIPAEIRLRPHVEDQDIPTESVASPNLAHLANFQDR